MKSVLLVMLIAVVLVSGCVQENKSESSYISYNIDINFSLSDIPYLGNEYDMIIAYSYPYMSADNASFQINIPEGLELISGDLEQVGELNRQKEITLRLKSTKTGVFTVSSWACVQFTGIIKDRKEGYYCTDMGINRANIYVMENDGNITKMTRYRYQEEPRPFLEGLWRKVITGN